MFYMFYFYFRNFLKWLSKKVYLYLFTVSVAGNKNKKNTNNSGTKFKLSILHVGDKEIFCSIDFLCSGLTSRNAS